MSAQEKQEPISINTYFDRVNAGLRKFRVRVIGEVSEVTDYGGARSYLFFKLKGEDNDGEACVLSCLMWQRNYALSGIKLETGMEVIVSGYADVYKPSGRFTFQAETVEPVGEGLLKKAYEELKAKLTKEGVFASERKRPLPLFPHKIGLITSKDGAAIGDFQVNLGRFGFKVTFVDSRVEGQQAIHDLVAAVRTLSKQDIEVLVITRGGGSLEALLPFNNEALVREIVNFPVPVLAGIGHEKDVSLVCLAADYMVSTPSIAAETLNSSWEKANELVRTDQHRIFQHFETRLTEEKRSVERSFGMMRDNLQGILDSFNQTAQSFGRVFASFRARILELKRNIASYPGELDRGMRGLIHRTRMHISAMLRPTFIQFDHALQSTVVDVGLGNELRAFARALGGIHLQISSSERLLETNNPERQLRLGYSIVRGQSGLIKRIGQVTVDQEVDVRLQDGSFAGRVAKINKDA
jgi:exodeoxyribonuclease VII large subunit